jgi:hypothetical protein
LDAIRPRAEAIAVGLSGRPSSTIASNDRIQRALKQPVPMRFPDETRLDEFISYVEQATRSPDGNAIPIYIDPIGLQEAEKRMSSTLIGMNFEGVPLRSSLEHALKQLDLAFAIKDGLLVISSMESIEQSYTVPYDDPFQIVGHCLLALIAAGLGGMAAPLVCDLARGRHA